MRDATKFDLAIQCSSGNASETSEVFSSTATTARVAGLPHSVRPLHEPVHGICMMIGGFTGLLIGHIDYVDWRGNDTDRLYIDIVMNHRGFQ